MRVSLFITCFNDTLFPNVGIATTRLLERLGHTVDFPQAQTCCGQMHYNTGYQRESVPLVRHFVEVFGTSDLIVAPSASCVGMVRDLYPKAAALSGDTALIEAVKRLVPRVYELSEFLVKRLGITDVGAYYPHRVTYHPTCQSCACCTWVMRLCSCCVRSRASIWLTCPMPPSVAASVAPSPSRTRIPRWPCSATKCVVCWIPVLRCCVPPIPPACCTLAEGCIANGPG